MYGLWGVYVNTQRPDAGVLVVNILFLLWIGFFAGVAVLHYRTTWPAFRVLILGVVVLAAYYFLHIIDLSVHMSGSAIKCGYIFVMTIFEGVRIISDVLVVWGACMATAKFLDDGTPRNHIISAGVVPLLLWPLALAHLGLRSAMIFTWLSFADLKIIDEIARARSATEAVYTAVEFVIMLLTALMAAWGYNGAENLYTKQTGSLQLACAVCVLVVRSFCEVVIVGEWDRTDVHVPTTLRARDICYGIFSVPVVTYVAGIATGKAEDIVESMRPKVEDETRQWFADELETRSAGGTKTAPRIDELLQELREENTFEPGSTHLKETKARMRAKAAFIDHLIKLYGDWEPIVRWPGAQWFGDNAPAKRENLGVTGLEMPIVLSAPTAAPEKMMSVPAITATA